MTHSIRWSIVILTIITTALVFLDSTMTPIALPVIQNHFHNVKIDIVWVMNTYLLSLASFLIIGGKLYDVYGVKRIYLLGLCVMVIGSLLCCVAPNIVVLLVGRAIQGMGSALSLPTSGPILVSHFPPGKRGKAIGISTGCSSIFLLSGPLLGGSCVQYFHWRALFVLPIPLMILGYILGKRMLHSTQPTQDKISFFQAIPIGVAIICFVTAFMEANTWGWISLPTITLFMGGIGGSLLFWRMSRRELYTVIDLSLFRYPRFTPNVIALSLVHFILTITVLWTIFFQSQLRFTPMVTGIIIMLATFPILVIAPVSGIIYDRYGAKLPITTGFALHIVALSWFSIFVHCSSSFIMILPGILVFGLAIPLIMSAALAKALEAIPSTKLGSASSLITTLRQVATTLGMAIFTAAYHSVASDATCSTAPIVITSLLALVLSGVGLLFTAKWITP